MPTESRHHAKTLFDAVEEDETISGHCNGQSVADLVPVKAMIPAWKKPPQVRLSLGNLSLSNEVLADRGSDPAKETDR
ncbi:MAG TPA: prevent-host-death protein [Thermoanaerobaculia bacterium]